MPRDVLGFAGKTRQSPEPENNMDSDVQCETCCAIFVVIWHNSLDTQGGPQFCPFCGEDWSENVRSMSEDHDDE